MEASDLTLEKIDIKPTTSYVSPEVKKRAQFKFYNNTYTYITIRQDFAKTEDGERRNLRALWNDNFVPWLQ